MNEHPDARGGIRSSVGQDDDEEKSVQQSVFWSYSPMNLHLRDHAHT